MRREKKKSWKKGWGRARRSSMCEQAAAQLHGERPEEFSDSGIRCQDGHRLGLNKSLSGSWLKPVYPSSQLWIRDRSLVISAGFYLVRNQYGTNNCYSQIFFLHYKTAKACVLPTFINTNPAGPALTKSAHGSKWADRRPRAHRTRMAPIEQRLGRTPCG